MDLARQGFENHLTSKFLIKNVRLKMLIIVKMPKETSQQSIFSLFLSLLDEKGKKDDKHEINNDLKICSLL